MSRNGLRQVHKAAALGDAGQSPFHRRADRSAYGGVCLQPLRVELGIAAAEVQAVIDQDLFVLAEDWDEALLLPVVRRAEALVSSVGA